MRMIPNNILWVITLPKWQESVKFRHAPKKVQKTQNNANISKTVHRTKNASMIVSFLCGSSRAIQRFLFQVATTNSIELWPKMWILSESEKRKITNISKTVQKKYGQHFCAAHREESNGLCFRSIRPIVFELWPKMWIWICLEWIGPVVFEILIGY